MDENVLITSEMNKYHEYTIRLAIFSMFSSVISFFIAWITWRADRIHALEMEDLGVDTISFTDIHLASYPMFWFGILLAFIFVISIVLYFNTPELSVTDSRIYGKAIFGKRVDLPIDVITAISFSMFNSITVSSASGAIHFLGVDNRDDIYETINNLLAKRQQKNILETNTTIGNVRDIPDELKKYKELLDNGIITQEEFDAKKKQLLDL